MRILIGAPVRTSERIFEHYVKALRPLGADLFFFLHNSPNLAKYLNEGEYEHIQTPSEHVPHVWNPRLLMEVSTMKNRLLKKALDGGYDYFFLVDSDTILHPDTLKHLLALKRDIVAEVCWTKWKPQEELKPNAWMYDFYEFGGTPIESFKKSGLYEVGGVGGVVLISRKVIAAGVNYTPIPNLSTSLWEDRAFCVRAAVHGFKIHLDTQFPANHLYREEDVIQYEGLENSANHNYTKQTEHSEG
jgi:hypothetical protein